MRKYLAEAIGSFAIVFCGTGAIIINQQTDGTLTHIGVALCFGLVVLAMIYAVGDISGAHLNPAVSLAFYAAKKFPAKELAPYILSQLTGAIMASALLKLLFPLNKMLGSTVPAGPAMQSFVMEIVLMFLLMTVIINVATGSKEKGIMAGVAIGATVLLEAMFAGPISGASMNPARSFGPAIISGVYTHIWIYIAAPVIGALLAVLAWSYMTKPSTIQS